MRKFIIATIVAGSAVLGLGGGVQAAPVASPIATHFNALATSPAVLDAAPGALVESVQYYGPRNDWRRRQEARRRAEWRRRQAHGRGGYRRY